MLRGSLRALVPVAAVVFTLVLAGTASAAPTITVTDAQLLAGHASVQLTVQVTCDAPAGATSYLSTTLWQGSYTRPNRYLEGQGQTQVLCDGVTHTYVYTATTTADYAGRTFKGARAFTESGVQYCTTTQCTPIEPLVRQTLHLHR
jgi:hypothetical protein